jgi:DNA-binding response OmpR family regulator
MTRSARILLVDDDAAGRTALCRALRRMHYEVEAHAAGAPALESLGDGTGFDLVITDIKMPGMDGLELLRRVKEASAELPVILITAFGTIENAVEAISQGASDYLTKPLGLPEVRAKVTAWLRGMRELGNLVVEGRDIGSAVFPDAEWKFYLDASAEERARRRHREMSGDAADGDVAAVAASLTRRDRMDSGRKVAPLKSADGAHHIDSTGLGIEDVVAVVMAVVDKGAD